MRTSTTVGKLALILSWIAGFVLAFLPFHAFMTVWLASAIDHYTLLRLWKEALLAILAFGALYILLNDKKLLRKLIKSRLVQLIGAYFLISLTWGSLAYVLDKVTLKALGYGLTVNLRYLVFFLSLWVIATKSQWLQKAWTRLLLVPAAVAIFIGLSQRLVLPHDVLRHFGYSEQTIFPYQTINHDIHYLRVMSTLRGANPLGAYMVLILSTIGVFFLRFKQSRWQWGLFGFAALLTLFFSYSRGAWIGSFLCGLFLVWISIKNTHTRNRFLAGFAILLTLTAITAIVLRDNSTFQNYFFHTNNQSTVEESSNEGHITALRGGLNDIATEPLGRGVGTAGPASVYNDKARVADNYFIQITQEVGWIGVAVFVAINLLVFRELWHRKSDKLALILITSFIGLTVFNLFSHAWTDDTLAYMWWGLAGIALATPRR